MSECASRILLIDDDQARLVLCQQALEQAGCIIQTDYIPLASFPPHCPFELALLNFHTLIQEHLQPLRQIRSQYPDVPVILIVDKNQDVLEPLAEAVQLGIQRLVLIPFDPAELPAIITSTIEHAQNHTNVSTSNIQDRAIMEHATDAVVMLDAAGKRILDANPAAARLSGYSRRTLRGREFHTLVVAGEQLWQTFAYDRQHGSSSGRHEDLCWLSPDSDMIEPLLQTKSGRYIPISISTSHIPDQGRWLVIIRDMRKRWHLAQQLIQNEKFAAIGRLMSGIAHEINNPLQAIQNSLCLLTNPSPNGNGEKRQRYLHMAREEVERMNSIVQRVLDVYRPAREGMRPTDLHELLHTVLGVVSHQLSNRGIQVACDFHPRLPLVCAIGSNLKQVSMSLILNAMESMPDGGLLTIRTYLASGCGTHADPGTPYPLTDMPTPEDESDSQDGVRVVIEFSDTGRGIPPDDLMKVFEPFYTTRSNSIGLGLAISYSIVEQHRGKLSVSSTVGRGTTFRLCLPVGM